MNEKIKGYVAGILTCAVGMGGAALAKSVTENINEWKGVR